MGKEDVLAEITKRTDTRLAKQISSDAYKLNKAITTLEKKIVAQVSSLTTGDNGNLVGPKVNLKQAQKIHTSLVKQFDDLYGAAARDTVAGYSIANNWVVENYSDLGLSTTFTDFDNTMINQLNSQSILNFTNIGNDARARVEGALYQSIAAQVPMENLIGEISAALTGQYAVNGRPLSAYASLYANDALMNYYNSVHVEKGRQLGLDKYYYSGTVMGNTREFCRNRVGNVYTAEQINSWNFSWSGKSGPAMTNRGGWNCRHHWQPVDDDWIDDPTKIMGKSWEDMSIDERLFLMKERGMAMSAEEKLFKKRLNQLRYNLKTKTPPGEIKFYESNLGKMWYNIPEMEKAKIVQTWESSGLKVPKYMKDVPDFYVPDPPASFVKIPGSIVPDAPTPVKAPPKVKPPPTTPPKIKPETQVVPPADVDSYPGGLQWDELSKKQKKDMGQLGYNFKVGKAYNPASQPAKTWEALSYEAQQMKLNGWKAKGFTIPSNLPIKGEGNVAANIINNATNVIDDAPFNWYNTTSKEASEEFAKKFGFKDGVFATNYATEAEGLKAVAEIGEHWDGVMLRHSKLEDIVKEAKKLKTGKHVIISNSETVGQGAAGVYSDQDHILELAGKLKKKGTIHVGQGGWSVASDFAGVSRHEFGHYIDNTLRQLQDWPSKTSTKYLGWNHQSEWRKLYKKHQSQWSDLLGSYSAKDKYEGFAEAFCAYTSPDYKVGMLPKDIEKYLGKLIGGKGKPAIKPVVKPKKAKVGQVFASAENQKKYEELYNYYKQANLSELELQEELKNLCPNVFDALKSWQGSTQSMSPSALKLKAELLEARDDIKFFTARGVRYDMKELKKFADNIPDEEYIRVRAFNQEYFARTKTKTVKLKRGTDGDNAGPKFASKVNEVKSQYDVSEWDKIDVEIREPALNGWSTNLKVADNFGANGGGITTTTNVPIEDVFCSDKLWPKYSYKSEKEWIIIRSEKQTYKLSEIESGFHVKTTEQIAAKAPKPTTSYKPVPQKIKDEIEKLPSHIDEEVPESVSLYIQNIPGWKEMSKDELISKLNKKVAGINNAIGNGEPAYIFPNKLVQQDAANQMKKVVESIKKTDQKAAWIKAVEEYDLDLFEGYAIDPITDLTNVKLSKSLYSIQPGAQKLPEFITNEEHMKTLSVKILDQYDWNNTPKAVLKDNIISEILGIEADFEGGVNEVLGHAVAGDVQDDLIAMLHGIVDKIDDSGFKDMVKATKLTYY